MTRRNRRGNLFILLLLNYILFTLLIIVGFIGCIILFFSYISSHSAGSLLLETVADYDVLLSEGKYDLFPTEDFLGKNGSIAVLDVTGNIIYNPKKIELTLTAEDLRYINGVLSDESLSACTFLTQQNINNYEVIKTIKTTAGTEKEVYIFDENYKLIYGSGNSFSDGITEMQYKLISDTFFENYSVRKYIFKTDDGELNTLLLFKNFETDMSGLQSINDAFMLSSILFYIIYALLIFGLILWLKRKINNPLQLLCDTFRNFEEGKNTTINYKGPKEFVQLFEGFSSMASRLNESEQQRKKLEADKSKILADIVHDLKTPVTVIQGYARALRDGIIPPTEHQKYLDTIGSKTDGLNELINTFFEYSKTERADYVPVFERKDICAYLRDFAAEQYYELGTAGFTLETEIPERHIFCNIDKHQLKRAFSNIVGNSVKHNITGTKLYIGLSEKDGFVEILIADNGAGIPKEIRNDIFKPFVVGETSRTGYGSGLGLSIVKNIVKAHHGTIQLLNTDETKWSTAFLIRLPGIN